MKKIKIVELSGLRGLLVISFITTCLIAGFVIFPAWGLMELWNLFGTYVYKLPQMNLAHGFMLYAIIILLYVATSGKSGVGISSEPVSNSQIATILKDIDKEN